ncbi:CBS domain-containing protein [Evansella clarkii]|uniref:CBS domain-containing protein n=1 Tax=Evansella clarkii TaxID=79879 RepID=UPI000B442E80|nr:CBS domain-containing protein [Evansella clarkii]
MQIILSHNNLDFDGLASMIAANKLYPEAAMVLPARLSQDVRHFLAIYKDTFKFKKIKDIPWDNIKEVILVDTSIIKRLGEPGEILSRKNVHYKVYDHHPVTESSVQADGVMQKTGACITLLAEEIIRNSLEITDFEATVFALGLYTDTGAFTYEITTARDLRAGAYFLEKGANLSVVEQYRDTPLPKDGQALFQILLENAETITVNDAEILVSSYEQEEYSGSLAHITRKIVEMTGASAAFCIVKMGAKVFITSRASSGRINVLPVISLLGGGGHTKAAAAMLKQRQVSSVVNEIKDNLHMIVVPSVTAAHIMSSPVRVVSPETTIEDVSKMLYRYGHTGFPVVENDKLTGIISRRDVDKALHHGLGHAPVKGFMSRHPVQISSNESMEKIQELMIEKQVGRLPVTDNEELIGIVSRTDVIKAMHGNDKLDIKYSSAALSPFKRSLDADMREQFSPTVYELLKLIGREADILGMKAYLIGGMVRDLLLGKPNEDIDIVAEGDGIELARHLRERYGGSVRYHEDFRTATWKHPSRFKIDITSARTEYYDFPAALPKVEMSSIKEDLYRRDFTINAMGICLHKEEFSELIDYFHGYEHLRQKKIKVLYNLSFVEDPTRILRALRFENRFGFRMDSQTEQLARQSANNLTAVSRPRIASELSRLFYEEAPASGAERIFDLNLQNYIIKRSDEPSAILRRIKNLSLAVNMFTENGLDVPPSIWIAYLLVCTPMEAEDWEEVALYSKNKEDTKLLKDLYALAEAKPLEMHDVSSFRLSDWHSIFSETNTAPLLIYFAVSGGKAAEKGLDYLKSREKLTRKVKGELLIEAGFPPGPVFKELLHQSERIQLDSPELTTEDILSSLKIHYKNRL